MNAIVRYIILATDEICEREVPISLLAEAMRDIGSRRDKYRVIGYRSVR